MIAKSRADCPDRMHILALRGFSIPQKTYLNTVVELASGDDIGCWQLGETENSDAVLINADTLSECRDRQPGTLVTAQPIQVVCTQADTRHNSKPCLQLPLSYSRIVTLLSELHNQLMSSALERRSRAISTQSGQLHSIVDVLPSSDQFRRTQGFYEETRLLGLLRELIDQGQPVAVHHPRFASLCLYPQQGLFASASPDELNPAMFRTLVVEFSAGSPDQDNIDWHGSRQQPLWRLLFLAALYGSEGRLHKHLNQDDRLELLTNVDFSVVPEAAPYRPIATFMRSGEAASVHKIAACIGVRVEKVIDFCNACEEVFLLHCTPALATASNANITTSPLR